MTRFGCSLSSNARVYINGSATSPQCSTTSSSSGDLAIAPNAGRHSRTRVTQVNSRVPNVAFEDGSDSGDGSGFLGRVRVLLGGLRSPVRPALPWSELHTCPFEG
jgi:hypothetical protein